MTPVVSKTDGRRFDVALLRAVAGASTPLKPGNLRLEGVSADNKRQKLRRLRASSGCGDDDAALIDFARRELSCLVRPDLFALEALRSQSYPTALQFARDANMQELVIGDWIELGRSPDDKGWPAGAVTVRFDRTQRTILARGKRQGWLEEKKSFLRDHWKRVRTNRGSRDDLVPNQLKVDLVALPEKGLLDAPWCAIDVGVVDWQTCLALNERSGKMSRIDARWTDPRRIVERRGLPGMIVAHVVVQTVDRRFLCCQRQRLGLHDERGKWSLSIEERWSGELHELRDRAGHVIQERRKADESPHQLTVRAVREELGITISPSDVTVLSWGIESSVLYPGFIALAKTDLASDAVAGLRAHASDPNEIRYVASIPIDRKSFHRLFEDGFAPEDKPELRAKWHRTSKARLFTVLCHVLGNASTGGRKLVLQDIAHHHRRGASALPR